MKRNILVYGLISGLIVSVLMGINLVICTSSGNFEGSIFIGYGTMLIAFSMVFVGVKNYRDRYNAGVITFGKAFKVGILITLIASTIYVLVWLVEEQLFFPDFMERYMAHEMEKLNASGMSATELQSKVAEMDQAKEMYQNPLFKVLMTYFEILPVGVLVTLISSLILRRKVGK